jgi:hypothetical protein
MSSRLSRFIRPVVAIALAVGVVATVRPSSHPTIARAAAAPVYAYVGSENGHFMHVINTATQQWGTSVGDFSNQNNWRCNRLTNTANHAGTTVYNVNACQLGQAAAVDTSNGTFSLLPFAGTAMTVSPDDQYMYVVTAYYRMKYKLSDNTNVWQVMSPGYRPYATQYAVTLSNDGTKLYVPMQDVYMEVDVLDAATGATLATVKDNSWNSPSWTVASPTGTNIYVGVSQGIAVIDSATDTFTRLIPVGVAAPVAVSSDGTTLYGSNGSTINKIRASDGTILATYSVATGEGGVALTPDQNYLYAVTGTGVSIIRLSDSTVTSLTYPVTSPNTSVGRTIVMSQRMSAPSISLSRSSGSGTVNSAVSSLYSINNSGDAASSYSIAPALPAGLSFNTSTGLITGTPTSVSAQTTYTITATNAAGSSTDTFALAVSAAAGTQPSLSSPTPTADGFTFSISNYSALNTYTLSATGGASVTRTAGAVTVTGLAAGATSTVTVTADRTNYASASATVTGSAISPTTTSTTIASSGQGGGSGSGGGSTSTTVAVGQSKIPTVVTTTTVVGSGVKSAATPTSIETTTTTTTIAPPDAPSVARGEAVASVDGKAVQTSIKRVNDALVLSAGQISATVYAIDGQGHHRALDAAGDVRFQNGDSLQVDATGFEPKEEVQVWLHSSPVLLGTQTADATGHINAKLKVPAKVEVGNHTLIFKGTTASGSQNLVSLGVVMGATKTTSLTTRLLIIIPVTLAAFFALIIPATRRRRRVSDGV